MDPIDRYFAALEGGSTDVLFEAGFKAKVNGQVIEGAAAIEAVLHPPGAGPIQRLGSLDKGDETAVTWKRGAIVGATRFRLEGDRIAAIALRW